MGIAALLTGRHESSARVADGRLILSLPDAETPVLWIMDLDEAATAVIRLEMDKQGHCILKKYGTKTAAETIAVYRSHRQAEKALVRASKALEKARDTRLRKGPNNQPVMIRKASLIGSIFTAVLYVWTAGYLFITLLAYATNYVSSNQMNTLSQMGGTPVQSQDAGTPDVNASGVPLSANDFLKNNQNPNAPK